MHKAKCPSLVTAEPERMLEVQWSAAEQEGHQVELLLRAMDRKNLLAEIASEGYQQVQIRGESEIADVCRLTCIEQGFEVVEGKDLPILQVEGYTVALVNHQSNESKA
ncbi:MAG: hypothetical protein ACK2TT_06210, partial [Anaerolineales bacterium]